MPNEICWIEIPAPNLVKATTFYGTVFGWTHQPMGPTYAMFDTTQGGGGFSSELKPTTNGPVLYISVADIPVALAAIVKAGGAIVKEKTEIGGDMGFYALFADPNGNQMGVWSKT